MKNFLAILGIVIVASGLYGLTLRGMPGNPVEAELKAKWEGNTNPMELSPERGRFAHVIALADHGKYALDQQLADFVYPDVGYWDGRFYSFFAPGLSYMAEPFYDFGKAHQLAQVATFALVSLFAIAALVMLFVVARDVFKMPRWAALASALIFGFGCTSWSYAITLYQHLPTVFFILSSFYAVWRYRQRGRLSWAWGVWVWLAYALAISIDYPNAFFMLPIMVYFVIAAVQVHRNAVKAMLSIRWSLALTSVAFMVVTGLHFYHNQIEFGSWHRISSSLPGYKTVQEDNILASDNSDAQLEAIAQKKAPLSFFSEQRIPRSIWQLLFSTDRGLFFYAPIFALAVIAIATVAGSLTLEMAILLSVVACNLFLYGSWGDPWGGWAYGPRYLIPSMSILSLFIGIWVSRGRTFLKRISVLVLFIYSAAVGLLGALTGNAIPPDVEAVGLNAPDNMIQNIRWMHENFSGSYVYRTYLAQHIPLEHLYLWVLGGLVYLMILLLFVMPLIGHDD